jgi:hypothetical protein
VDPVGQPQRAEAALGWQCWVSWAGGLLCGCRAGRAGQVGRRAGWRARQAGCAVLGRSASGLLLLQLGYCRVGLERKMDEGKKKEIRFGVLGI